MKTAVQLDFLQANQIVAALQERTARLSAARGDPLTYRAIVDCLAAEFAVRMAFDFPAEAQLDAAHEASVAEMREWSEAELREAWGR